MKHYLARFLYTAASGLGWLSDCLDSWGANIDPTSIIQPTFDAKRTAERLEIEREVELQRKIKSAGAVR